MNKVIRNISFSLVFIFLMLMMVGLSVWLKPNAMWAEQRTVPFSDALIPAQFADWQVMPVLSIRFVNPELEESVAVLYSDVVSRTYINSAGDKIMLSIAYGKDQSDSLQMHYPEVCYPAQGFAIESRGNDSMTVVGHDLPLKQLVTQNRSGRRESLSYWTVVGERLTVGRIDKKLSELELALKGFVADGLIFRVSSIDRLGTSPKFEIHKRFVTDLVMHMPDDSRELLFGRN